MSKPAKEEVVLSPCVGVCALDDDDICIGCWRSGAEITRWGYVDNDGRRAILKNVEERLKKAN